MVRVLGRIADPSGAAEKQVRAYFSAEPYWESLSQKHPNHRQESLAALAALADLLSDAGISAGVRLAVNEQGRPYLPDLKSGLDFNLTHSGGVAFCALSDSGSVGIDAERIRPLPRAEQIASRFFSEGEQAEWKALTGDPTENFFRIWTRKEAYLKYLGTGFSDGGLKKDTSRLDSAMFQSPQNPLYGCIVTVCKDSESAVSFC